ncbi:hypothetical protein [Virgisporangium aurantiacum]|uniref:DUF3846 domain-containing protein n=1 Tax=Virgisporangium aurantiacum TaxID=175570 RepID=A0A8J3ZFP2_9ACTN|nr:hypothetical protein [Virgisporangium aurantiacum]GIJ62032.1 hypothetical protein Vau01_095480 [Virgisporangium aurantiacum]
MSTTVSTTMTLTRPRLRPTTAAPASTREGTAVPAVQRPSADLGYLAMVSVHGDLLLPAAVNNATATAMRRRTQSGTAYRIDLGGGITCWLDADQQDGSGELNWAATQMCTALSDGTFAGPEDAPFVCGPALFTGTTAYGPQTHPVALSDEQLRRIVDVHADHIADIDTAMVDELGHFAEAAAVEPHLALT